jgi:hypothetical protein
MLCVRAGVVALCALEQAGIACAGFKGLAALACLYPGMRSRTLQDTDVLIHPSSVEASLKVLEAAGFKRFPEYPWDEYVAFLRNSSGTAGNEAVRLRDERGGAVDLHWHLGILDVETLLSQAVAVEQALADGANPVALGTPPHPRRVEGPEAPGPHPVEQTLLITAGPPVPVPTR